MKKNIFSMVVLLSAFYGIVYISGILGGAEFILSCLLYAAIFYSGHVLIALLRKKDRMTIVKFLEYFAYRISSLILLLVLVIGSFVYYQNEIEPARLPEFTVTNGKKTVVFQGMAHIGSDKFYKEVQENIRSRKKQGYVYFYEGVKMGEKRSSDKFDKLLGVKFDKKTYVNISKIYGLRAQNNLEFLGIENDRDYNADISMDKIIALYEEKYGEVDMNKKSQLTDAVEPVKVEDLIDKAIDQLTPRELNLLIYVNRSVMNFIIKNENVRNTILEQSGQKNLFDVILDDRNKVIIDSIINSPDDKIYITYGLMHFNGVWMGLQGLDPDWRLESVRYLTPIE